MIETTTHIAESAGLTLCGLDLPPVSGAKPPGRGSRVGLTIGRFTYSCYLTGPNDSNPGCVPCLAFACDDGLESGFDAVPEARASATEDFP